MTGAGPARFDDAERLAEKYGPRFQPDPGWDSLK